MSKTRLTQMVVLACITTLAACTSGEEGGSPGNTQLNVVVPNNGSQSEDPNGNPQPPLIDIQTVEYTINCTPGDETFLDDQTSVNRDVQINGNLEVVDGQENPLLNNPTDDGSFGEPRPFDRAEIWQDWMDIPAPSACSTQLRARDDDGEVICTATETFNTTADAITKVNIVLMCDISFQAPVAQLDVDATFSFNVGNFCPDLFVINCLDSNPATPPVGETAESICEVRFRDADSSCGDNCDPQTCQTTTEGMSCTAAPEPRVCPNNITACDSDGDCPNGTCDLRGPQTVVTCTGGGIDCDDDNNDDGSCTYNGDQLGSLPVNAPIIGNPATFDVLCDQPGATVICTAVTTDGDVDCNKTKTVAVNCPGLTACGEYGTSEGQGGETDPDAVCQQNNVNAQCTDATCNDDLAVGGSCAGGICCQSASTNEGVQCDSQDGQAVNPPATCVDGVCTTQSCLDIPCPDIVCKVTQDCNQDNGFCEPETPLNQDDDEPCTDTGIPDGVCDTGVCIPVECRTNGDCAETPTDNPCTENLCDTGVLGGSCSNPNLPNNADCSPPTGGICFVIDPDPVSQCVVANCTPATVGDDCTDTTACAPTPVCNIDVAGGVCEYPALDEGTTCATPNADPASCQSGVCGVCDDVGVCNEKPATCDRVFRDVVPCPTLALLSADCTIFSSGVPIPLDPSVTPAAAAVAGIPVDVQPQATINLTADLTCGFSGVIPDARVFNSSLGFSVGGVPLGLTNSFIDPNDPLGGANPISPHTSVVFDFFETCGTKCDDTVANPPDGFDGFCQNDLTIPCRVDKQAADCVTLEGTGPGLVANFLPRDPPGSEDPADPSATGVFSITPATTGLLSFTYSYDELILPIGNVQANICIGGACNIVGFIGCPPADRTGPARTDALPPGCQPGENCTDDPGICRSNPDVPGGTPLDCVDGRDAPRIMYDSECTKLGAAACGGTACPNGLDAECPFGPAGAQTCNDASGLCRPVNFGFCGGAPDDALPDPVLGGCTSPVGRECAVNEDCDLGATCSSPTPTPGACATSNPLGAACVVDDDCPYPPELIAVGAVCCEPYFEYNAVANVCAAAQPGTTLADTDAPTVCGGCQPLRCVGDPANEDIGTCRNGPNDGLPCDVANGISQNPDCPQGADPDVEVICRTPCNRNLCVGGASDGAICVFNADCPGGTCNFLGCNAQECCDLLQGRYVEATPAQFPVLPVNPGGP